MKWEQGSIQILYRDSIKVFYKTVESANQDGYTNFDSRRFGHKKGLLYSFTGLRGDARDLYKSVVGGQEDRV